MKIPEMWVLLIPLTITLALVLSDYTECGDVMKLQIKVDDETGIIEDAKFKTFGCGSAIAASSLASEWVKGRTIDKAMELSNTEIVEELSLPPVKIHCSVLAEDAIKAAINDYKEKQGL